VSKLRGEAKTKLALKEAEFKVDAAAPRAEEVSARIVALNMQARAPVDTGYLRNSIRVEGSKAMATARYAVPVDRGTATHRAQPFAEEAAEASRSGVIAAMTAVFRTALGGR
jgi:Bacteriophage HK97-gp10, putative tail-component